MEVIRILIVDDQKLFASSLRVVLDDSRHKGLSVVGVASNGRECVDLLEAAKPDIILMDVRMPVLDGVETTKIIHKKYPRIRIMMLTTFDDDALVHDALVSGATGYVLKNIEPEELIACIRAIAKGNLFVSSSVGYRLLGSPTSDLTRSFESSFHAEKIESLRARFPNLKNREAEVLYLVLKGMDNHQISQRLFIAEQTVKNYTSVIYSKIGVQDRLQAIRSLGGL